MIAFALNAAPAGSFYLGDTSASPSVGPTADGAPLFHSVLAAAHENSGSTCAASAIRSTAKYGPEANEVAGAKNAAACAAFEIEPVPRALGQAKNAPPLTQNISGGDSAKTGDADSDAPLAASAAFPDSNFHLAEAAVKTTLGARLRLLPQFGWLNAKGRPQAKSTAKASAADKWSIAALLVPAPPANTLPLAFGIPAVAGHLAGGRAQEPATVTYADASSQRRSAQWEEDQNAAAPQAAAGSAQEPQPDSSSRRAAASAADDSLSKVEPAFQARLQPIGVWESSASATAPAEPGLPGSTKDSTHPELVESAQAAALEAAPSLSQAAASSFRRGGDGRHQAQERPNEQLSAAPGLELSRDVTQAALCVATPAPDSAASSSSASGRSETPTQAAAPAPPEPPAEASPRAAHDIKLELNGGGQRVEVRLTDRGGDIHVAVRTPDARLSSAMRDDLPGLTAKLEQSGFRTDVDRSGTWLEPTGSGELRMAEAAASSSHDPQERSAQDGQQGQDNPQQKNPNNPNCTINRKSDRKDFAWLLQTYR